MLELKRRALIVIGFAVLLVFTVACDETPVAVPRKWKKRLLIWSHPSRMMR